MVEDFFKSVINDKSTQVNDIKLKINGFDRINGIDITLQGFNTPSNGFMNTENESPCAHCPNNPAVNKFASGICHCILAVPTIF